MMILNIIAVLLILWGFLLLCMVFIRGRDNDNPPIPISNQNPHFQNPVYNRSRPRQESANTKNKAPRLQKKKK